MNSMKKIIPILLSWICLFSGGGLFAQTATYTNFLRQVQNPSGVQWDVAVAKDGTRDSGLEVPTGGSRYELWTVKSAPLTSYLLDTTYVGAYTPDSSVNIRTEDPYPVTPRTRADRPYWVDVKVKGLSTLAGVQDAAKLVKLLRYTQSYGTGGTGVNLNRSLATLLTQSLISNTPGDSPATFPYPLSSIPGTPRNKIRGEERYSIFSLADVLSLSPESMLSSKTVVIWPVATATISDNLVDDQVVKQKVPNITVDVKDLYPASFVYGQIYQGAATPVGAPVKEGIRVDGTAWQSTDTKPLDGLLAPTTWDSLFTSDGLWTFEVLTITPFGTERLDSVTFTLKRILKVNATVTTME